MIIPAGIDVKTATEEELVAAFMEAGYNEAASRYLSGKLKGTIKDDHLIL